jgi:hypothetical protein
MLLISAFNCVEAGDIFRRWIADSVGWRKLYDFVGPLNGTRLKFPA